LQRQFDSALRSPAAVMDQPVVLDGVSVMQSLLERIEDERSLH
jgi:hypothetical protein